MADEDEEESIFILPPWLEEMQKAAEIFNVQLLIGCRPNGTWFAHGNSIEYDGPDPTEAIKAVINEIVKRTESNYKHFKEQADNAGTKLAIFKGGS
jgi:hypothetical protein